VESKPSAGSTLSVRETVVQKLVFFLRLLAAQPVAIFTVAKTIQLMQRWVTGLRRNSFGIQRGDEVLGRDSRELARVDMKM